MKIALFSETYLPTINGVVTHVHSLRVGLEKLGHQVLVVCGDDSKPPYTIQNNVLYCPGKVAKRFYNYTLCAPYSKKRKKIIAEFQPDIVHVHTEFGLGYSGMRMAKSLNIPLVYTLHTMYDEYIYYVAPKPFIPLVTAISHKYFKLYLKQAAMITGPSQKCGEYAAKIGINKPVTVVPNPVELDLFDPDKISEADKEAVLKRYGLTNDLTIAAFVGRLGKEKSADLLLKYWSQAVTKNDKMRLLIIGDGPEKPHLEQLSAKLGISDTVIFTGKVPHNELPPYYGICQLYITASLSDTNSISMLEGMAFGLPVLQRLDRLNEDQVVEGVNGYVYETAQDFQNKLNTVRNLSPEERQKLTHSVRQSVQHKGYETLGKNLLTVYEQAVEKIG